MKPCKIKDCTCPTRYANTSWCRKHYYEREREKKAKKAERKKNTKKAVESRKKTLINKLDRVWSLVVRAKRQCDLCGHRGEISEFDAHHIRGRARMSTRFDPYNGACLCKGCHRFGVHQDTAKAALMVFNLQEKRYVGWWKELNRKAETIYKPTEQQLEELLKNLTELSEKI